VKRIQGKKLPLIAAGVHALPDEYTHTIKPARAWSLERKIREGAEPAV
jgi:hypothetical protein